MFNKEKARLKGALQREAANLLYSVKAKKWKHRA
jgi:hypothetical protein